jgi:branched-chain amino acid aminotransferase
MALVYLNGKLLEENTAVVSVFDHGFTTGDGVFESVLVENGRTFALERHLDRLAKSAAIIGIASPARDELREAVAAVVGSAGFRRAKVRITVTPGSGPLASDRGEASPSLIVAIEELRPAPRPGEGTRVAVSPWPRSNGEAIAGAKTISYVENVVVLAWAHRQGADEALFVNRQDNLCEGTGSNVFVAIGGRLLTPPLSSGCLAGVTRGLVIETSGADETDIPIARLAEAEEAFLTSTSRGVLAIAAIDNRPIRCPGPLTLRAAAAYLSLLASTPEP